MLQRSAHTGPGDAPARKKYVRAVGPRLRKVLYLVFGLVALLGANSLYLASITLLEWLRRGAAVSYQTYFYQLMFLGHLALGLLLVAPFLVFGLAHILNAHSRPNRRAVRVGYLLFVIALTVLFTGIALMRFDFFVIKDPRLRSPIYWAHVLAPLGAVWLYILHRLAGPRIQWRIGLRWAATVSVLVVSTVFLHSLHPRQSRIGPVEGKKYFEPSQARTASGKFIPARTLMMDSYCLKCHADAYEGWFHSAHHFSSFNNPPYLFSVRETRAVAMRKDGQVKASRWCAGCHDVVPFFSGAFDDPNYDLENHPTAKAGITCTACHAITHVNSTIGNADYTIDEPIHYPFAYSSNSMLQFVNQTLVKAKPEFHKRTFLKPLHRTSEFCSTCHKVSLPGELTNYKDFLRGQNHSDTFLLSGVSGHGARSFYYPETAQANCAGCHMPLQASKDFGAKFFAATNHALSIHSHFFPAANTGLPFLRGEPKTVQAEEKFLKDCARIDLFGVKEGGSIDGALHAPLRPTVPVLKRGGRYLVEAVVRTLKLGHPLTQGTTDSNEVWVEARLTSGGRLIGSSGGLGPHREVDPWAHFINVYMLDRDGNRVDRRNPQDIFTPLYDHQIPPGAGAVVHYEFTVPEDAGPVVTVEVKLQYRKFDTIYLNHVLGRGYTNGSPFQVMNDLPITTIASDLLTFPIESPGVPATAPTAPAGLREITAPPPAIPEWQRWNDYGIGLLLEGNRGSEKGELIQAAQAFAGVEKLGRADGPLNLARVYFKEGRLDDAAGALQRAAKFDPPAPRWTRGWLDGLVNKELGNFDLAISDFRSILGDRYPELDQRGFDFSLDYEVINELGKTLFERARQERGEANRPRREAFLWQAVEQFRKTLTIDSENLTAHYNLALLYDQLGEAALCAEHRRLHERFRLDDNARDRAITIARRRDPAADHAAQAIVIYPLQRPGAMASAQTNDHSGVATR
ncbi:MAG: multiheme c-type cytochrome [Verrucomicrobia bacterium]|nr:multiheme c-type cytochrome [Verrucomicrobiota bacterium]